VKDGLGFSISTLEVEGWLSESDEADEEGQGAW